MIALKLLRSLLIAATVSAVGMALHAAIVTPVPSLSPERSSAGAESQPAAITHANPDSLRAAIAARNLFRPARRSAGTRLDPRAPAVDTPERATPQKPLLRLVGIAIGPDSAALLEGIPGIEGTRVARRGERIGELLVTNVGIHTVTVAGYDTTWVLTLRRQP